MPLVRALIALPGSEAEALARALASESELELTLVEPEELERELEEARWEVIVADVQSGVAWLDEELPGAPAFVLVAGFGSVSEAVATIRRGAFDYLSRPLAPEQLAVVVRRAAAHKRLSFENALLRDSLEKRYRFHNLVTRDAALRRVFEVATSVASTRATLLITGESGTGKTMLARAVHGASERREGPFVEVNCGALPASLLESELFGHAKGAFTGAISDKLGRFEAAGHGTLFLDEIATAPLEVQVKLLRVLQDRAFERLGETKTRTADVRLVCATNENLAQAVASGRFREDLFYRINVVRLEIPPLRARPGDVVLLAHAFLERYAKEYDSAVRGIHPEALAALAAHRWPGNVRQLENAIERAVLLACGSELTRNDFEVDLGAAPGSSDRSPAGSPALSFPPSSPFSPAGSPAGSIEFPIETLKKALEAPEKAIIERALAVTGGNRQETARLLGVNRTTLFNKMRKYGLLDRRPLDRSA